MTIRDTETSEADPWPKLATTWLERLQRRNPQPTWSGRASSGAEVRSRRSQLGRESFPASSDAKAPLSSPLPPRNMSSLLRPGAAATRRFSEHQ